MIRETPTDPTERVRAKTRERRRLAAARARQLVWMDAEEAAAYLNYPKATLDGLAARGGIPHHKRGAGWRYYRMEPDEWLLTA